jgi:dynein light intermediate chain
MSNPSNITTPNSLVKYANPVLVSTSGKRQKDKKDKNVPSNISNAHTEDILNSILPPREYTMDKQ